MRKQKQLYLEGKRQRAIGYDFSPLMGDPFDGFQDEGVVVGNSNLIGEGSNDLIPTASKENMTMFEDDSKIAIPGRIIARTKFQHPMVNFHQDLNTTMDGDYVNHVMEKNVPVAL